MSNDVASNLPGLSSLASKARSTGTSAESLATQAQNVILHQLGVPRSVLGPGMLREMSEELGKLGAYLQLAHDRVIIADSGRSTAEIEAAKAAEKFALGQLTGTLSDDTGYTPASLAAARKRGAEAAQKMLDGPLTTTDWSDDDFKLASESMGELADDPVAAGAFFDELRKQTGGEDALRLLTTDLSYYQQKKGLNGYDLNKEQQKMLAAVDKMLGDIDKAISGAHAAGTLPDGFANGLAEAYQYDPSQLAVLLSYGTFSEDFLVELEDVMFTKNQESMDKWGIPLYQDQRITHLGSGFIDGERNPFTNDAMAALLAATARTPGAAERILFPNGVMEDYDKDNDNRKKWEYYAETQNISYASGTTADGLALAVESIVQNNVDDKDPKRQAIADYAARDIVIALDGRSKNLTYPGAGAVAGVLAEYPDAIGDSTGRNGPTDAEKIRLRNPAFLSHSLRDLLRVIGQHDEYVNEVKTALATDWSDYADGELEGDKLQKVIEDRMTALGALTGGQSKNAADKDAFDKAVIGFYIEMVANAAKLAPTKVPGQGVLIGKASDQLKEWFAKPENREKFAESGDAGKYGQIGAGMMIAAGIQTGKIKVADPSKLEPFIVNGVVNWTEIIENPNTFNTILEGNGALSDEDALDIDDIKQEYDDAWEWTMGD